MDDHYQLNDADFEKAFETVALPPELFNHDAHIRLAWLHIKRYGVQKAISNVCHQIKQYAESQGAPDKFNKTLTVAAVKAVYHFTLQSNADNFRDFINEHPRLKFNFKALMASHYNFDIYKSPRAKKIFFEPDLLPFDC